MLAVTRLLADSGGGIGLLFVFLIYTAIVVLYIAGLWKVFEKAGQKGWFAIIPILNLYILIKIAGREGWWIILFLIPCINIIVAALVYMDVAQKFGKTAAYGIGMWLLGFIFIPMLGFGDAEYSGDKTPLL
jgi:hypothetical protein